MRLVFVRDLEVMASIGIYDFEKAKPQRVVVNIELSVPETPAALNDNIDNVVSYETVANNVKKIIQSGHLELVETLAELIAASCLEDGRVAVARVRVEKPDIIANARSVGVEILRYRD